MNRKTELSELSLEELFQRRKKVNAVAAGLGIVMALALAALIYLSIKTKNYALMAVAGGSAVTFLPIIISVNELNKEIKSRTGNRNG